MQKLRCLVIEDEPLAAEIVQSYIEQVSFLTLEGICTDAISAFEILKKKTVDVIFLDIHLPKLKGIDFLKTLKDHPQVIITSAYKQYALDGFEMEIIDYLLKPFSFARFLKAVNRLNVPLEKNSSVDETIERKHYYFNANKKKIKIYPDEILYVESLKDYVKIVTQDKSIVTKFQLGEIEKLFGEQLIRVHRSFLVSKDKVESISTTELEMETGKVIPVGRSYLDSMRKVLKGLQ